jgi:hypothetical protein
VAATCHQYVAFEFSNPYNASNKEKRVAQATFFSLLATVDNNDTVSYGCIMVALWLHWNCNHMSEKCNPQKRVRQIGIYLTL